MKCQKCKGKGFIESVVIRDGSSFNTINQCCDITAYSNELQRRMNRCETDEQRAKRLLGMNQESGQVLQFKRPVR